MRTKDPKKFVTPSPGAYNPQKAGLRPRQSDSQTFRQQDHFKDTDNKTVYIRYQRKERNQLNIIWEPLDFVFSQKYTIWCTKKKYWMKIHFSTQLFS